MANMEKIYPRVQHLHAWLTHPTHMRKDHYSTPIAHLCSQKLSAILSPW